MKQFRITLLMALALLAAALSASWVLAEFYRYVDKDGVTHFVDDPGKIPPEFQGTSRSYEEKYDHLPEKERLMRLEQDRQAAENSDAEPTVREQDVQTEPPPQTPEQQPPEGSPPAGDRALVETAVVIKGDHVLVPVVLGYGGYETEALLLLDTGATIVSLQQDVADRIHLAPFRTARAQMADGKSVPYKLAELDFIIVGPHRMEDVMVGIYRQSGPPPEFNGLLGMNVVKNFEYTIDFSRKVIRWKP